MTHSEDYPQPSSPHTALPRISRAVLAGFRDRTPDFDSAEDRLRAADPLLAGFLLARASELAPGLGGLPQREVIARLALETYGLLAAQAEVNSLEATLELDPTDTRIIS